MRQVLPIEPTGPLIDRTLDHRQPALAEDIAHRRVSGRLDHLTDQRLRALFRHMRRGPCDDGLLDRAPQDTAAQQQRIHPPFAVLRMAGHRRIVGIGLTHDRPGAQHDHAHQLVGRMAIREADGKDLAALLLDPRQHAGIVAPQGRVELVGLGEELQHPLLVAGTEGFEGQLHVEIAIELLDILELAPGRGQLGAGLVLFRPFQVAFRQLDAFKERVGQQPGGQILGLFGEGRDDDAGDVLAHLLAFHRVVVDEHRVGRAKADLVQHLLNAQRLLGPADPVGYDIFQPQHHLGVLAEDVQRQILVVLTRECEGNAPLRQRLQRRLERAVGRPGVGAADLQPFHAVLA